MVTGLIVQPSSPIGRPLVSPHRIAMPRVRPARRQRIQPGFSDSRRGLPEPMDGLAVYRMRT